MKNQVSPTFPDEVTNSSKIHVRVQDLVLTEKFDFFLSRRVVVCWAVLVRIRVGLSSRGRGRRKRRSVLRSRIGRRHHLLVDMFDHFPDLEHVRSREFVLAQWFDARGWMREEEERYLDVLGLVLVDHHFTHPCWTGLSEQNVLCLPPCIHSQDTQQSPTPSLHKHDGCMGWNAEVSVYGTWGRIC